jgi:hypothetical protein
MNNRRVGESGRRLTGLQANANRGDAVTAQLGRGSRRVDLELNAVTAGIDVPQRDRILGFAGSHQRQMLGIFAVQRNAQRNCLASGNVPGALETLRCDHGGQLRRAIDRNSFLSQLGRAIQRRTDQRKGRKG